MVASSGTLPASCAATVATGALVLQVNYLPSLCDMEPGGYAYAYSDKVLSSACLASGAFCGQGTTGAQTPANSSTVWGAGIGVNLNQPPGSMTVGSCAATGSGIAYAISGALPPQGMRLIIDNGGMDYCAPLSSASGTVPWSAFNTTCWQPSGGMALSGPPATATHVELQVNAAAAQGSFDFCVTALKFM